jgi:hypothetical protein
MMIIMLGVRRSEQLVLFYIICLQIGRISLSTVNSQIRAYCSDNH